MLSEIGPRIKQIREHKHITQEKLAELSNMSWSAVSRLETGKTMVSIEKLFVIAKALDIGIECILCDYINTDNNNDILTKELLNEFGALNLQEKKYIINLIKLYKSSL